jgi:hypothetical protein
MADTPSLPDGPALIVVGGPTDGEVFPLEKDRSLIVGSGRLANLRLGPSDISSAHLKITWDDGGLFVNDNTSFTGTYLNGESVEQAPLQDGDLIAFADPKQKPDWPKLRLHVPAGSVVITTPPPEPEPEPQKAKEAPVPPRPRPAPRPPARGPVRGRVPSRGLEVPGLGEVEPKVAAAIGGGAVLLVLLVVFLARVFFGPTPTLTSVQPASGEPGQSVILAGDRFSPDPAGNKVRFGEAEAQVKTASVATLTVIVPDAAVPGESTVSVQVGRRRSRGAAFRVLKALRISALDPEVALPGEEVTAKGSGLDSPGLALTVEGKPAQVLEAQASTLRFKVPGLAAQPVRSVPVLARTNEQLAKPVELMIGKLPLVLTVGPRSVEAGDKVTLKGKGFAPEPASNHVLVGREPALVLSAGPTEITFVVPDLGAAGQAPIMVEALGRSSTASVPLQVGAGSSATYRLRFFAAPAEGVGRAYVSMVAAPVLLLAAKDDAASVEERAVKAAVALNALADSSSQGRGGAVEARNPPALAAVAGNVIARVTAEDAAAYSSTAPAVAAHWAALVGDYLAMFARAERPTRLFATTGRARSLLDLQAEVGFRPGTGVAATRMARLSVEGRQKLRDMALQLSPPAPGQAGAAVEGIWEGELRDSDGSLKAVTVELRLSGSRLSGTLSLGQRRVAVRVPLQDVTVQGGSLRFTLVRGGRVQAFEAPVAAGEVSGPLHEGSLGGPAIGRLTLRYVRAPG